MREEGWILDQQGWVGMLVVPNDASAAEAVIECFEFGLEAVEDVATASIILESCERSLANGVLRTPSLGPSVTGQWPSGQSPR